MLRPLADPLVDLVAHRLHVLGQPVRVRLLDHLDRAGESNVQALADELATTQQNTSKHLGILWRAGIVSRRSEGRVTVYELADSTVVAVIEQTATVIAEQLRQLGDG